MTPLPASDGFVRDLTRIRTLGKTESVSGTLQRDETALGLDPLTAVVHDERELAARWGSRLVRRCGPESQRRCGRWRRHRERRLAG